MSVCDSTGFRLLTLKYILVIILSLSRIVSSEHDLHFLGKVDLKTGDAMYPATNNYSM